MSRVYVEGNNAVRMIPNRQWEQEPVRRINHSTRRNRDRIAHMNFGYVIFLSLALIVTGYVLVKYIGIQAELTTTTVRIATLQKELNELVITNDDKYDRIWSNIDLDNIRHIAITELGMQYAKEGQIIIVSEEGSDYVEQVASMP